ncbi:MAG: pyridoxamine 5'-phosphate oxidase family protein [Chloroflexi bacterium]|nr:pyridoxamine 5'-phosphate oxidase family protein [Chloroflexota bacterium]MCL5108200.1 pyridoxamine 5'-phosphate oxidase family protein [Chloroflexota bacterium]
MGEIVGPEMPIKLVNFLRGGRLAIVATVGPDGKANSAPFSWVLVVDKRTLRLGVNQGVATLANIRHNGSVSVSVVGPNLFVTVKGKARVIKESLAEAQLPTAVVEIAVEEVKDDAIIGRVEPGQTPTRWTDRRRLVSDSTVLAALGRD